MYWLINQFPELDHLEPDQRAHVLARIPWWTYPLLAASAVIPAIILGGLIAAWLAFDASSTTAAIVSIPIAATAAIALYARQLSRVRTAMRTVIAEAFRDQRLPFCFHCGYNLRDSTAARCPECGHPVHAGAPADDK